MANNQNESTETKSQMFELVKTVAIGAISMIMMYQWSEINTLKSQMYDMRGNSFTEEKGRALEDRLTRRMEAMQVNTDNKLDTILLLVRDKQE